MVDLVKIVEKVDSLGLAVKNFLAEINRKMPKPRIFRSNANFETRLNSFKSKMDKKCEKFVLVAKNLAIEMNTVKSSFPRDDLTDKLNDIMEDLRIAKNLCEK